MSEHKKPSKPEASKQAAKKAIEKSKKAGMEAAKIAKDQSQKAGQALVKATLSLEKLRPKLTKAIDASKLLRTNRDILVSLALYTVAYEAWSFVRYEDYGSTLIQRLAPAILLIGASAAVAAAKACRK